MTINQQQPIPYSSFAKIDKRPFAKDGYFIIEHSENDKTKKVILSDKKYDNLGLLLDELIRQTQAAPADSTEQDKTS